MTDPIPMTDDHHLLTVREAAEHLQLSQKQVRRYLAANQIRHANFGRSIRISPADLRSFVERMKSAQE